jgi:putative hydrolase of the HAD superfamily
MPRFDLIALDADDTLWYNERLYQQTQSAFAALLEGQGVSSDVVEERLYQTESRNLALFGYGIKSFTLSMIETAVELTDGKLAAQDVQAILALGKAQISAPLELLEHAQEAVAWLVQRYHVLVITKGDLLDQEAKLMRSGLADLLQDLEVVTDKTSVSYARLFKKLALDPQRVMMVGDSLRSDILPVLQLGAHAVYVPHPTSWQHEAAALPAPDTLRFYSLENLGQLPALLERLD